MTMEIIEETGIRYIRIPLLKQDENDIVGKDILSEYDYNILKSAKIPGLASLTKRITDGEAYLQISVRSYISLVEKIEDKALCKEDVYDFFKQLLMVYEDMQSYLLQENMICLEPEWIFYDKEKKKYVFLPITAENSICEGFEKILAFFIEKCDLNEQELLNFLFEIYGLLDEEKWEVISLIKYIVNHKDCEEKEEESYEKFEESLSFAEEETQEEKDIEKTKIILIVGISVALLVIAFFLSYMMSYQFRYSVISIVITSHSIGLLGVQTYKIMKNTIKRKSI